VARRLSSQQLARHCKLESRHIRLMNHKRLTPPEILSGAVAYILIALRKEGRSGGDQLADHSLKRRLAIGCGWRRRKDSDGGCGVHGCALPWTA
jgi:hypothetical protein